MANTPNSNESNLAAVPAPAAPTPAAPPAMVLGNDEFRVSLEPKSLAEAFSLAQVIAKTRICGVESMEDAMVRILTGRSLGLSSMQSLRTIYVVEGRPSLDASAMHAICLRSPLCEYFDFIEGDETHATFKTKRRGRPERAFTYTIEDARRQGLLDKGSTDEKKEKNNWNRMPKQMLRARAKSELARIEYPDLLFGMYSREELIDMVGVEEAEEIEARIAAVRATTPREIEVEIVETPVRAAPRDFDREVAELKARIKAATTKQSLAEARDAIAKWDGPDEQKKAIGDAYSQHLVELQAAREAKKTAATSPASPSPMPEGNLFDQTKGETKS